jgi:hypothetical protein
MPANLALIVSDKPAPAPVTQLKPAKPAAPRLDPVREAAVDASATLEAANAMHDAVERLLERRRGPHGVSSIARLMCDAWRAGAVYGGVALAQGQIEAGIADALADIIDLDSKRGPVA